MFGDIGQCKLHRDRDRQPVGDPVDGGAETVVDEYSWVEVAHRGAQVGQRVVRVGMRLAYELACFALG